MSAKQRHSAVEERLRSLPSVDRLLATEPLRSAAEGAARSAAVAAARNQIEHARAALRNGGGPPELETIAAAAAEDLIARESASLRRVVNATGVVVHTNLGRAPLAESALAAIEHVGRGYSNLELDLGNGSRGSRHSHVEGLVCELTGGDAGFAVNNNAGAVLLALAALAPGREVVISRGQLVEIGGSFRIPEILAASGAELVEVGTTNRTRLEDYERAIGERTAAVMRVHRSNFELLGFTEDVEIEELCALARERGVLAIDDLGSGVLAVGGGEEPLAHEPAAGRSVAAGADVVCFSGDKLLGGPQAGIVAGRLAAVARMRAHPIARAVRIDKLSLAALEATLLVHRDPERAARELPVLRMIGAPESELQARASRLRESIAAQAGELARVELVRSGGRPGGGALPLLELEGPVVSVVPREGGLERLRTLLGEQQPPVIGRLHDGALLLDPRTIAPDELGPAAASVCAALRSMSRS